MSRKIVKLLATAFAAAWGIGPIQTSGAVVADAADARNATTPAAKSVLWEEVLRPVEVTLPPPREALPDAIDLPTLRTATARTKIRWDDDLPTALRQARQEDRPVFVTLRCLPCKTCSEFDKEVLEGGPDLDPLFRQFITVRLISAKDVDLRLLPMPRFQDMDVSWWGYFLSPQGQVYGIFGGRDEVSDLTRNSKAALVNAMRRVLAYHYDPRRPQWEEQWNLDGRAPGLGGKAATPVDLPGFQSWLKVGEHQQVFQKQNCIHCHEASEILRQPAIDAGTFDKDRDLQIWPLPENVGLVLNRDDGLRADEVRPGSPAARAGLKPGDVLGAAASPDAAEDSRGRRLFGQADFRGVLHRGPRGAGTIDLWWTRDGKVMHAPLEVADGWRKTDLSWRTSVAESNLGAAPGFWPNPADKDRQRLGVPANSMAVHPTFYSDKLLKGPAAKAGLKASDVIVAVDGQSPNIAHRAWLVWFRLHVNPGDEVTLTVQDAPGQTHEVRYKPTGG